MRAFRREAVLASTLSLLAEAISASCCFRLFFFVWFLFPFCSGVVSAPDMPIGRRSDIDNKLRFDWHTAMQEIMQQEGPVRSLTACLRVVSMCVHRAVRECVDAHFGATDEIRARVLDEEAIEEVVLHCSQAFADELRRVLGEQAMQLRVDLGPRPPPAPPEDWVPRFGSLDNPSSALRRPIEAPATEARPTEGSRGAPIGAIGASRVSQGSVGADILAAQAAVPVKALPGELPADSIDIGRSPLRPPRAAFASAAAASASAPAVGKEEKGTEPPMERRCGQEASSSRPKRRRL